MRVEDLLPDYVDPAATTRTTTKKSYEVQTYTPSSIRQQQDTTQETFEEDVTSDDLSSESGKAYVG